MNLNRLAYFAAVVDTGSFTRAAERLGITKAVVSQQVTQLEQELRTSLLVRTTRRVHPTEAGRMFHARCVMILREAEDAFNELTQAAAEPTGTLRITAPNDYGIAVVVPVVTAFTKRYPGCRVEQTLSDQTMDLTSGKIDMAIRVGWLADSSLQARKIGSFRQLLVGAPAFADRIAATYDPKDLAALPFIANMALREPLLCQFSRSDLERRAVRMQASMGIDTTPGVLAAVRAGGGLSVLPDFLVAEDLASGRLSHALPEWQLPSGGIYTVYPAAQFRPRKVTAFVEMLIAAERNKDSIGDIPGRAP
ncbi:LysR family transcriptional regulator [Tardiphaga sp. 841_E9_N1_2]|jgi:DNA-binding transcriptional LysR family regulator|uniref:LysR family transcriptional regulator n=1 Tax=Tardiphaga sp. 841_E9_N1_2 TaxID=3240762 RepID=UPI003F202E78